MDQGSQMAAQIAAGDRRALARAITLIESTRPEHRKQARALISSLPANPDQTIRLGMTGTPGVGKSTLIENLGLNLIDAGHRVAVLAVDPSSARTGGAILGDKTRMERLSRARAAFIRPSPSRATLGGVGRRTRETIRLVEAWGADIVLVETVGVGQSETMVADMTDVFVLLLAPEGGDELQGVKRGVMEMADIILVNKADGSMKAAAARTCADYSGALRLLRSSGSNPEGFPCAMCISAQSRDGLDAAWEKILELVRARRRDGTWLERRRQQDQAQFRHAVESGLIERIGANRSAAGRQRDLAQAVAEGKISPEDAADRFLDEFANVVLAPRT